MRGVLLPAIPPVALRYRAPRPALLHRRAADADSFRPPAPRDAANEDPKQHKPAEAAGDADDKVAVIVYPAADLFTEVGAFALTLIQEKTDLAQDNTWEM